MGVVGPVGAEDVGADGRFVARCVVTRSGVEAEEWGGYQEAFPSSGKACRRGGTWAARELARPSWVCRARSSGVRWRRGTSRRLVLPRHREAAGGIASGVANESGHLEQYEDCMAMVCLTCPVSSQEGNIN